MKKRWPLACFLLTFACLATLLGFELGAQAAIQFGIYIAFCVCLALIARALLMPFCRCIGRATVRSSGASTESGGQPLESGAPSCGRSHWITFTVLWLIVVAVFVLYPAMPWTPLRTDYRLRLICGNRLRTIALAFDAYHARYGAFPPPHTVDKNGRPCVSWRVLLLPFFFENHDEMYRQIRLNEPWDSVHNRRCLASDENMAYLFRCPAAPWGGDKWDDTNYLMVLRATQETGKKPGRAAAHVIFIVEVRRSGINWAEPKDINIGDIDGHFNEASRLGIGSYHRGLAHVLLRNGDVRTLYFEMPPEQVKGMLNGSVDPATLEVEYAGDSGRKT